MITQLRAKRPRFKKRSFERIADNKRLTFRYGLHKCRFRIETEKLRLSLGRIYWSPRSVPIRREPPAAIVAGQPGNQLAFIFDNYPFKCLHSFQRSVIARKTVNREPRKKKEMKEIVKRVDKSYRLAL